MWPTQKLERGRESGSGSRASRDESLCLIGATICLLGVAVIMDATGQQGELGQNRPGHSRVV